MRTPVTLHSSIVSLSISLTTLACLSGCGVTPQEFSQVDRQVTTLQRAQADRTEQIATLETQVRELSGRVEELEFLVQRRFGTTLDNLKNDLTSLKRRVPPPSIVPADALEDDERAFSVEGGAAGQALVEGLTQIRQGNFRDAEPLMRSAVDELGDQPEAGVALFWLGVIGDGMADPRAALSSYNESITRFPRAPRAPLALLRLSSVFSRLGDNSAARLTLQKLVAEFPKSPEAARAKERLAEGAQGAPTKSLPKKK